LESHSTGVYNRRLVLPWIAIPPTPPQTTRLALRAARALNHARLNVHALHEPVSVEERISCACIGGAVSSLYRVMVYSDGMVGF
jgi:hypothetical protein